MDYLQRATRLSTIDQRLLCIQEGSMLSFVAEFPHSLLFVTPGLAVGRGLRMSLSNSKSVFLH